MDWYDISSFRTQTKEMYMSNLTHLN